MLEVEVFLEEVVDSRLILSGDPDLEDRVESVRSIERILPPEDEYDSEDEEATCEVLLMTEEVAEASFKRPRPRASSMPIVLPWWT